MGFEATVCYKLSQYTEHFFCDVVGEERGCAEVLGQS